MTTIKNVLHFVTTGSAKYMFNVGKELFFVPAIMILKCLSSRSDVDIYAKLTQGKCRYPCKTYVGLEKKSLYSGDLKTRLV